MSSEQGKEMRTAELNISFEENKLTASCHISGRGINCKSDPLDALSFDRAALDGLITNLKDVLTTQQTSVWAGLAHPLCRAPNPQVGRLFKDCVENVVARGAALYDGLCDNGLAPILDMINSSLDEGDRITIQTNCAFFPWEILYPHKYDLAFTDEMKKQYPLRQKSLWGYKYLTEYNLLPDKAEKMWEFPTNEYKTGTSFISFNLNKWIDSSFRSRPFKPIKFQKDFFTSCIGNDGEWLVDQDAIVNQLVSEQNKASVIYIYCHGTSNSPLASSVIEALEFHSKKEKKPPVIPNTLSPCNKYLHGPIVFLNSCTSAAISPLSFSSFHKTFRKKKAMGMIGTTIQIPATFAAAFGRKLIEAYLSGVPIGRALYHLRRQLLDRDNPLGLFYSLQCPSGITAPRVRQPCPQRAMKKAKCCEDSE